MKKIVPFLPIIIIPSFFLLLWCFLFPLVNSSMKNWSFYALNFPKKEADFKMPKGYKLLYSPTENMYQVVIYDPKWSSLHDLKMYIYSTGTNTEIWSTVPEDKDVTKFKDSSIAKYYAHLYYNHENPPKIKDDFKPLTK